MEAEQGMTEEKEKETRKRTKITSESEAGESQSKRTKETVVELLLKKVTEISEQVAGIYTKVDKMKEEIDDSKKK